MATPVAGVISLNDIRKELEIPNSSISMGQFETRALCGVMSGVISMSDLYDKRYKDKNKTLFGSWCHKDRGGNFDLKDFGFKPGMEITHFLFWASKYEKTLMFYQYGITFGGEGVMHYLPYPLKYDMNRMIHIPTSANYHDTTYYGYIIYPDGLNKPK